MPLPQIILAAASSKGAVAAAGVAQALTPLVSGAARQLAYQGNYWTPNTVAPPEDVFHAWAMGELDSWEVARDLIAASGFGAAQPFPTGSYGKHNWKAVFNAFQARRPRPSLDSLLNLRARGFFSDPKRWESLANWYIPNMLDFPEYCDQLNYTMSPQELVHAYQRKQFDRDQFLTWLRRTGVVNVKERQVYEEFARNIPGISDLIHFMVREALDSRVVDAEDYGRGFPERLKEWADKQGYGWDLGFPVNVSSDANPDQYNQVQATWAHLYWFAHWQRMSPTQSAEGLHRLRPGRRQDGLTWDIEQHKRLLRINDYPTNDQKVLTAISYRTMGRIDIKRTHYLGVWDKQGDVEGRAELGERYQDIGYTKEDADTLAESTIRENKRRKYRELVGLTRARVQSAYFIGIIDSNQASALLVAIGHDKPQADAAVAAWELEFQERIAKKLVAGVRRNYLLGDYQEDEARAALIRGGILPAATSEYITVWNQESRHYRLEYSPTTLSRWLILGTIDVAELERRLTNIGWAEEDVARIVASAVRSKKRTPPPEAEVPKGKAGRGGESKPAELTRSELRQLLQDKVMTRDEVRQALQEQGLDAVDQERLLKLWEIK